MRPRRFWCRLKEQAERIRPSSRVGGEVTARILYEYGAIESTDGYLVTKTAQFMHTKDCSNIYWDAPVIRLSLSIQTDPKPYYPSRHSGCHNSVQLALPGAISRLNSNPPANRHIYPKTKPDIHCYADTTSRDPATNANTDNITHFRPHWPASTQGLRFADGI
jgi:hypothetical protein